MIWLAWRRQRTNLLILTALAAALIGWMLLIHFWFDESLVVTHYAGRRFYHDAFTGPHFLQPPYQVDAVNALLLLLPCIIGLLLGVPLVAGELDDGTNRLAWTQRVTRTRWFLTKFCVVALPAVVLSGVLADVERWWSPHVVGIGPGSIGVFAPYAWSERMHPTVFTVLGIVPVAYTLFALALGAAVGAVLRRDAAGVVATLVVYFAALAVMAHVVRPTLTPVIFLSDQAAVRSPLYAQLYQDGVPVDDRPGLPVRAGLRSSGRSRRRARRPVREPGRGPRCLQRRAPHRARVDLTAHQPVLGAPVARVRPGDRRRARAPGRRVVVGPEVAGVTWLAFGGTGHCSWCSWPSSPSSTCGCSGRVTARCRRRSRSAGTSPARSRPASSHPPGRPPCWTSSSWRCPALLGVVFGTALVAGEYERSTHRLAWTQQRVSRTRWYLTSWAVVAGALTVLVALELPVAHWWAGAAWIDLPQPSPRVGAGSNRTSSASPESCHWRTRCSRWPRHDGRRRHPPGRMGGRVNRRRLRRGGRGAGGRPPDDVRSGHVPRQRHDRQCPVRAPSSHHRPGSWATSTAASLDPASRRAPDRPTRWRGRAPSTGSTLGRWSGACPLGASKAASSRSRPGTTGGSSGSKPVWSPGSPHCCSASDCWRCDAHRTDRRGGAGRTTLRWPRAPGRPRRPTCGTRRTSP